MRLLVVDDDRALRDVLRRTLSLAGYEVRLTESGIGMKSPLMRAAWITHQCGPVKIGFSASRSALSAPLAPWPSSILLFSRQ